MSPDERLWVEVEIDIGASAISGFCHIRGSPPQAFAGWTELFAALDSAVTKARGLAGSAELGPSKNLGLHDP